MKSRMTVTMMLVVGMLMSMSGAGLALSGSSGSGHAASVQYQTETTNTVPVTTPTTPATPTTPTQQVSGEAESQATPTKPEVKAAQQVAAAEPAQDDSGSLPFTGYSALPVLIGGLGVLGFGLMLRRRTREDL